MLHPHASPSNTARTPRPPGNRATTAGAGPAQARRSPGEPSGRCDPIVHLTTVLSSPSRLDLRRTTPASLSSSPPARTPPPRSTPHPHSLRRLRKEPHLNRGPHRRRRARPPRPPAPHRRSAVPQGPEPHTPPHPPAVP